MIDIHSHCLPSVDDGADSVETSLEMLENAKMLGADIVVATPHFSLQKLDICSFLERRKSAYNEVLQIISQSPEKYPRLLCGAEVYLNCDLSELDGLKSLCYDNTSYLLLELSSSVKCSVISEWIYNITINGIKPVIAHIDRFEKYKELMAELNGIDVVYQINASRFIGMFSRRSVKSILCGAEKFVVSSDMHNLTTRTFNMHEAYKKATSYLSEQRCYEMFYGMAQTILSNNI